MKNLLSLLMCGLLLFGCSKEYDDSDIKKRLDNLENTRIPSIESQVAAIQTSLPLLRETDEEIKGYITTLQEKVGKLEQSMSDVDVKIKALEYTLQTDFSQRLADIVSQLNAHKQEIQNKIDSFDSSVKSLQTANAELDKKITYLDGKIDMQKDWVTATFATLTQYNGLVADIATIRTNIETINKNIADLETRITEKIASDIATAVSGLQEEIQQKVTEITDAYTAAIGTAKNEITAAYTSAISSAIDNCIASMKDWVNEKLANYYNIAAIDAKVQLLQNAITQGDAAIDEKLRNEIASVNKSIETAKSELTTAYENAIKTAIETNNGIINNKLAQEISIINNRIDVEVQNLATRIDDIETRLSVLENKVEDIDANVTALLKRIQSISYIPRYSDGAAIMQRIMAENQGYAEFDFMISPKDAVVDLAKVWNDAVAMKAIYTQTRAVEFIDLPIVNYETDVENGIITLNVSGENLNNDFYLGKNSASSVLLITDGNNSVISNYIPIIADVFSDHIINYTTKNNDIETGPSLVSNAHKPFWEKVISNSYERGLGTLIIRDHGYTSSIGDYAFFHRGLTSINIPNSIISIGEFAFVNNPLTSVITPNSVTAIGMGAFQLCSSLTSITISENVTLIGDSAFWGAGLESIIIPNSVITVQNYAFYRCRNLGEVFIGTNVTSIGKSAFGECDALKKVYCKQTVPPTLGEDAFYNLPSSALIYVPTAFVYTYKVANGWSKYADRIIGYDFE